MTTLRICQGCHRPQQDLRPLCGECARTAVRHADAVARQDAARDLWGRKRAKVMASRRDRRARAAKGGPKGQSLGTPASLLPVPGEAGRG